MIGKDVYVISGCIKRVIAQDAGCDFMYVKKKKKNIQRKILEIYI